MGLLQPRPIDSSDSLRAFFSGEPSADENAAAFSSTLGFAPSPTDPLHLHLLIADARASLGVSASPHHAAALVNAGDDPRAGPARAHAAGAPTTSRGTPAHRAGSVTRRPSNSRRTPGKSAGDSSA